MSTSKPHNVLLVGLPSTGKTSFLAALWYAIQQKQSPTALVLKRLDGDSAYLNNICDAWLAFEPVGRNQTDIETMVSMYLKLHAGEDEIHLTFPDVSGETFKQQWASRQQTASYEKCIKSATGGILFVHAGAINQPLRISEVDNLAALIDESAAEEHAAQPTQSPPAVPWDIEKAPTQVQVVELLQFLMGNENFKSPFRLAIAVSAWDLVAPSKVSPQDWVKRQLPLLNQFFASHGDKFHVAFYGVSAQGGKYEEGDPAKLQDKLPARRIEIAGNGVKNRHDITEPLLWLMKS